MGQYISTLPPKLRFYGFLESGELKLLIRHLSILSVTIKHNDNCVPNNDLTEKSLIFLREFCRKYRDEWTDILLLKKEYDRALNDKFYWSLAQGTMVVTLDDIRILYKYNNNELEFLETIYEII